MSKSTSRFLISTRFQRSRSRKQPDKPGAVYIEITKNLKNKEGDTAREIKRIKTSLTGTPENYVDSNKGAIIEMVRLAYCLIERHTESDEDVSMDDVMADFRKALSGDAAMKDCIERAKEDFPLRADLVNAGDDLKRFFKFDYSEREKEDKSLTGFLKSKAAQFKNDGKVAASRSYLSTRNSIDRFTGNKDVGLNEVDRRFIEQYSQWLTDNGVAESTQSFYLRTLRSALNHASESEGISFPDNLFEGLNTKVLIPPGRTAGSEIDYDAIKKIAAADLSDSKETELTRDMFMFGFYCHGMELVDVLNLKKTDVKGDTLVFRRRQKGSMRKVPLDKKAADIIGRYTHETETYIFPMMEKYSRAQHYAVADKVRNNIKTIGRMTGYPHLTFSANITAWQNIMTHISMSRILDKA